MTDEDIRVVTHLMFRWDKIRRHLRNPHYKKLNIKMCKEWQGFDGMRRFIRWSIENGFQSHLTLDRVDGKGHYSPDNCRWVTMSENIRSSSKGKTVIFRGEPINMKTLSERPECIVAYPCLKMRIAAGWPIELAVTLSADRRNRLEYHVNNR